MKSNNSILFLVFDIDCYCSDIYKIILEESHSSTLENLLTAFKRVNLPKVDDFIKILHKKLKLNLGIEM